MPGRRAFRALPQRSVPFMVEAQEPTVLIVDDDSDTLIFLKLILEPQGYRVLLASHADNALRLLRRADLAVHLLLTNMVLPGANGGDFARKIRALRPALPILFMSRFNDSEAVRLKVWDSAAVMLDGKYPASEELLGKICEFLGATPMPLRQPQKAFRATV
jgi:DNA-binding response OmpR family regulator